jgi:hypothetical protein
MKKLLIILFAIMAMIAVADTVLSRVEKLTVTEIANLNAAKQQVEIANSNLDKVKAEIIKSHSMRAVNYMEWSANVVFDGDYILQYQTNKMGVLR